MGGGGEHRTSAIQSLAPLCKRSFLYGGEVENLLFDAFVYDLLSKVIFAEHCLA